MAHPVRPAFFDKRLISFGIKKGEKSLLVSRLLMKGAKIIRGGCYGSNSGDQR